MRRRRQLRESVVIGGAAQRPRPQPAIPAELGPGEASAPDVLSAVEDPAAETLEETLAELHDAVGRSGADVSPPPDPLEQDQPPKRRRRRKKKD